jgi:hypothetical protein
MMACRLVDDTGDGGSDEHAAAGQPGPRRFTSSRSCESQVCAGELAAADRVRRVGVCSHREGVGPWDRKKASAPAGIATPIVWVAPAFTTRSDLAVTEDSPCGLDHPDKPSRRAPWHCTCTLHFKVTGT